MCSDDDGLGAFARDGRDNRALSICMLENRHIDRRIPCDVATGLREQPFCGQVTSLRLVVAVVEASKHIEVPPNIRAFQLRIELLNGRILRQYRGINCCDTVREELWRVRPRCDIDEVDSLLYVREHNPGSNFLVCQGTYIFQRELFSLRYLSRHSRRKLYSQWFGTCFGWRVWQRRCYCREKCSPFAAMHDEGV